VATHVCHQSQLRACSNRPTEILTRKDRKKDKGGTEYNFAMLDTYISLKISKDEQRKIATLRLQVYEADIAIARTGRKRKVVTVIANAASQNQQ
jgi:hypothetical protein